MKIKRQKNKMCKIKFGVLMTIIGLIPLMLINCAVCGVCAEQLTSNKVIFILVIVWNLVQTIAIIIWLLKRVNRMYQEQAIIGKNKELK